MRWYFITKRGLLRQLSVCHHIHPIILISIIENFSLILQEAKMSTFWTLLIKKFYTQNILVIIPRFSEYSLILKHDRNALNTMVKK